MAERETDAMLTSTQRDFLRDQGDYYSGDNAKQQRYERRQQIVKRVSHSILDFQLLLEHLQKTERDKIFHDRSGGAPYAFGAVPDAIAFMFMGVTSTSLMPRDGGHHSREFEDLLERGLERAYLEADLLLNSVELRVDSEKVPGLQAVKERARDPESRVSWPEMRLLIRSGEIDDETIQEFLQEALADDK
jgi:hypothetical protein